MAACRLELLLRKLGLKPPGSPDTDPALGEAWWIMGDVNALTTLSLLLAEEEPYTLFAHSEQAWGLWQEAQEALLQLLEEASFEVRKLCGPY